VKATPSGDGEAKGRICDALVDCTDFFATFAELADAATPAGVTIDGRSFAQELDDYPETRSSREWMFAEYAGVRIVRDRRYKLYSDGRLYDIVADWLERGDLSGNPRPETLAARTRLQAVLDQLPPDVNLPLEPRSSSAFRDAGHVIARRRSS